MLSMASLALLSLTSLVPIMMMFVVLWDSGFSPMCFTSCLVVKILSGAVMVHSGLSFLWLRL